MSESKNELHKEFELERLILFSDAVFAIAITIIIIEIKFPEIPKHATSLEIFDAFKPTLIQFAAFIISFFFIGVSWARHLEIFRYLVKYNNGLIKRNLFFLFFVICFPFSASGITEHIRPGFLLPLIIYMFNITAVFVCQYFLCLYIFKTKPQLSTDDFILEKNYLLMRSKWIALILIFTFFLYFLVFLFSPQNSWISTLPPYILVVLILLMRRKIKKYKPVSLNDI